MASQHFQTRDWKATDTAFPPSPGKQVNEIVVSGEIQTRNTNEHPELVEARSGGSSHTLVLDLNVPSSGIGGDIVVWKPISFKKSMSGPNSFKEVEIKGAVDHTVKISVHPLQG